MTLLLLLTANTAYSWWTWTPGDTVDNSTQSLVAPGYKPDQPIPYSHKLHAGLKADGGREIPCQYCHSSARRSAVAGIPSLNTCMGCHKVVRTDKDPIKEMTKLFQENKPVVWTKVHDLPDHVRFTHKPHVLGKIQCQECHGPVEKMDTAEQWAPLQMGWCVGCHKERKAPISCNTCHF